MAAPGSAGPPGTGGPPPGMGGPPPNGMPPMQQQAPAQVARSLAPPPAPVLSPHACRVLPAEVQACNVMVCGWPTGPCRGRAGISMCTQQCAGRVSRLAHGRGGVRRITAPRLPPPLTRPLLRGIRANAAWPMHGQRGYCPCARAGVGTCRARACAYTSVLEYVDARSAVARVGRSPVSFQRIWARV